MNDIERIQQIVCDEFVIEIGDISNRSRTKNKVIARHYLCYCLNKHFNHQDIDRIASIIDRDRTTVYNSIEQARNLFSNYSYYREKMKRIQSKIHNSCSN